MEPNNLKKLKLLEAIADSKPKSQRELANSLHMSLGLVNSLIKRLVKSGYCEVTTIQKNRAQYILTAAGTREKTRLTYEYILSAYQLFRSAQKKIQNRYAELQKEGVARIVFYGAGDLTEIAYFSLQSTSIQLVGVADPEKNGEMFAQFVVQSPKALNPIAFDALLVTSFDNHETILNVIANTVIPPEKVRYL